MVTTPTAYLKGLAPCQPDYRARVNDCATYLYGMGWRVEPGLIGDLMACYDCNKSTARAVADALAVIQRC